MGDDSIGIKVLEKIQSSLNSYGIETFIGETDTEYCISLLEAKDFIFILDAAMLGNKTGDITIIPLEQYKNYFKGCSQHSNNLLDMMYVYGKNIKGYFIGIEALDIVCSLKISRSLQMCLDKISSDVLNIILELSCKKVIGNEIEESSFTKK